MKTREVKIFSGHKFKVPACIQRIDTGYTHGWQLRFQGTKMFSDHTNDGSGAAISLEKATLELVRRMQGGESASSLQSAPSSNKSTKLPVGISGPIWGERPGRSVREARLGVLLPRFGAAPQRMTIYVGSQNTYSEERFKKALKVATELRAKAETAYRLAEAKQRKTDAKDMKAWIAANPAKKLAGKPAARAFAAQQAAERRAAAKAATGPRRGPGSTPAVAKKAVKPVAKKAVKVVVKKTVAKKVTPKKAAAKKSSKR
jgi:hypothetical protein